MRSKKHENRARGAYDSVLDQSPLFWHARLWHGHGRAWDSMCAIALETGGLVEVEEQVMKGFRVPAVGGPNEATQLSERAPKIMK